MIIYRQMKMFLNSDAFHVCRHDLLPRRPVNTLIVPLILFYFFPLLFDNMGSLSDATKLGMLVQTFVKEGQWNQVLQVISYHHKTHTPLPNLYPCLIKKGVLDPHLTLRLQQLCHNKYIH